ncbi:MAG: hypothetical protein V4635_15205 [Bacteroidota bacterium]
MVSVIGIPIYFHYCGGELEKVNYVLKSDSCCGGEEMDDEASDSGCCKDENMVLKNVTDFTIKKLNDYEIVKTYSELCYLSLPYLNFSFNPVQKPVLSVLKSPPPGLQNELIISTSVIRV